MPTSSAFPLIITSKQLPKDDLGWDRNMETQRREDTCYAEMHPGPKNEELEMPGAEN